MASGAPRSQLFVKMGASALVPYGVGDTVSDIGLLMVNHARVIDVYYVSLYSRLSSRLDLSYKAVVWLSKGL